MPSKIPVSHWHDWTSSFHDLQPSSSSSSPRQSSRCNHRSTNRPNIPTTCSCPYIDSYNIFDSFINSFPSFGWCTWCVIVGCRHRFFAQMNLTRARHQFPEWLYWLGWKRMCDVHRFSSESDELLFEGLCVRMNKQVLPDKLVNSVAL